MFDRARRLAPKLSMQFEVGQEEPHQVRIDFDQWDNRLKVQIDGVEVLDKYFAAGLRLSRAVELSVGGRHSLRIEKTRQLIRGSFRPQSFTISVDGLVVARQDSASGSLHR
ncbi:hypothetical protein ACFPJ4_07645 [Lysinimonas soli]|uniref:Uncharacterized protein n=1 Tax=Lysinimonas soli TaxID=1074233 RepID=A0ABW0NQY5_9MICO